MPAHTPNKAIVLCTDAGYLPFALHLACQIDRLDRERDFDICLLSDTPLTLPEDFAGLGLRLVGPVTDPAYLALEARHLPRSTYLRLWAPHLLGQDYDRLLYLDCDMFAEAGGFGRLLDTDMAGRAVAAVRDVQQWYRPRRNPAEFRAAGLSPTPYLNGGLLLIDPKAFEAARLREQCLDLAARHPDWIRHHDQSLLNLVLAGDWTKLSPLWNWQWPIKYPGFTDWVTPRLLHFIGTVKPWNDRDGVCPARFAASYRDFLSRHFPDRPPVPMPPPGPLHSSRQAWRMAVRFLALRGRLLNYLSQFPDPWTPR